MKHWLHAAPTWFVVTFTRTWKAVVAAVVVAFIASFIPAAVASWANMSEPFGAYSWEWGNGAGRLLVTVLALLVILKIGEAVPSGVSHPVHWPGLKTPLGICVAVACIIPVISLFSTSWEATDAIAAKVWYFGITGPYEEIVFRGLLFHGLAKHWNYTADGAKRAAVISAGLFGLLHINPIAIVITSIAGIAFSGFVVATRSIWPAAIAHSIYDILADFPIDAQGVWLEDEAIGSVIALPFLVIGAILAWRRLGEPIEMWPAPDGAVDNPAV